MFVKHCREPALFLLNLLYNYITNLSDKPRTRHCDHLNTYSNLCRYFPDQDTVYEINPLHSSISIQHYYTSII